MKKRKNQLEALVLLVHYYTVMEAFAINHHFLQRYLPEKHDLKTTRFGREFHLKNGANFISSGSGTSKNQSNVFRNLNNTIVTAQTDTTVILHCEVDDIGDAVVLWFRKRYPAQILTNCSRTLISDHRFYASYEKDQQDWALHLRYATLNDKGEYECRVERKEIPVSSLFVTLELIEAHAEILATKNSKVAVKSGSPLRLSCRLYDSIVAPTYIFWYHGDRMINYDLQDGAGVRHGRQGSELIFPRADESLAGNYSCVPSNARQASVTVEILHDKKLAKAQHGSKNGSLQKSVSIGSVCIFAFMFLVEKNVFYTIF